MLITFFAAKNDFARLFYMFCSISARVTGALTCQSHVTLAHALKNPPGNGTKWSRESEGNENTIQRGGGGGGGGETTSAREPRIQVQHVQSVSVPPDHRQVAVNMKPVSHMGREINRRRPNSKLEYFPTPNSTGRQTDGRVDVKTETRRWHKSICSRSLGVADMHATSHARNYAMRSAQILTSSLGHHSDSFYRAVKHTSMYRL